MIARMLVLAGVLVTVQAAAQPQVYKWVDTNGNVTYSENPPPDAGAAEWIKLPPPPPPPEIEAAQQRAKALQELGDRLARERLEREAQLAEERRAAREEQAPQQPAVPPPDAGDNGGYDWWVPGNPGYGSDHRPPPGHWLSWPQRPVPPASGRIPSPPPDNPAYRPWEPVLPPDTRFGPRGRLNPLPPPR
jgi:hypothetical protein